MTATRPSRLRNSGPPGVSGRAVAALRPPLCSLALALALAAPAHAASRLIVRGAGFGHGVGMSQYGAMGFAQRGADHEAILRHYYRDTRLARLQEGTRVRVLLKTAERIVFTRAASIPGQRRLDPRRSYAATRGLSGSIVLRSAGGRRLASYRSPLVVAGAGGGFRIGGRSGHAADEGRYRGELQLRASSLGGVSAINAVGIEDYIRGVVAGEMPSSWPQAALRAQAVAARTYALATSKDGDGFDHYADTRSQVYNGVAGETDATDEAVRATAGQVVVHDGRPIPAYYFSTSGGRTENVENSFLGADPKPYLTSVDDPHDDVSPRHRWVRRMSLRSAQRRLGGLVRGSRLRRIRVLRRGRSPRVVRAQVVGSGGRRDVSGPELRRRLGLYDTWARFTVISANARRGDGGGDSARAPATSGGGATPRTARAAVAEAPVAGRLSGRVAPVAARLAWVTVQRRSRAGWVTLFDVPVGSGGRYSARLGRPGRYRVLYRGEAGPAVRLGALANR